MSKPTLFVVGHVVERRPDCDDYFDSYLEEEGIDPDDVSEQEIEKVRSKFDKLVLTTPALNALDAVQIFRVSLNDDDSCAWQTLQSTDFRLLGAEVANRLVRWFDADPTNSMSDCLFAGFGVKAFMNALRLELFEARYDCIAPSFLGTVPTLEVETLVGFKGRSSPALLRRVLRQLHAEPDENIIADDTATYAAIAAANLLVRTGAIDPELARKLEALLGNFNKLYASYHAGAQC